MTIQPHEFVLVPRDGLPRSSRFPLGGGGAADWQLAEGHYVSSLGTMQIINPQPSLNTNSYYYRCYPGLVWRVPISVLFGAWPFRYELLEGPSGMNLGEFYGDSDYGILSWNNPTTSGSPHNISVRVTDQEGTQITRSWTLTVTTSQTMFLDAVNGSDTTGDGTFSNPYQTINAWLEPGANSRNLDTYRYWHVYYFSGVYRTRWDYDSTWVNVLRMPMRVKPRVHIPVNDSAPIFDISSDGSSFLGGYFGFVDSPDNNPDVFFRGLTWRGINIDTMQALQCSGLQRMVFFENILEEQQAPGAIGSNASWIFTNRGSYGSMAYTTVSHNKSLGMSLSHFLETYGFRYAVVESNEESGTLANESRLTYFKENSGDISVRNNYGGGTNNAVLCQIDSSVGPYENIDITWNNWRVTGSTRNHVRLGITGSTTIDNIRIARNTFTNGTMLHSNTTGGDVTYLNNVRQYGSGTNGISVEEQDFSVSGLDTDLTASSGLVDSNNLLVSDLRGEHLGRKGFEVA